MQPAGFVTSNLTRILRIRQQLAQYQDGATGDSAQPLAVQQGSTVFKDLAIATAEGQPQAGLLPVPRTIVGIT